MQDNRRSVAVFGFILALLTCALWLNACDRNQAPIIRLIKTDLFTNRADVTIPTPGGPKMVEVWGRVFYLGFPTKTGDFVIAHAAMMEGTNYLPVMVVTQTVAQPSLPLATNLPIPGKTN